MVPKAFEPLKFYCLSICLPQRSHDRWNKYLNNSNSHLLQAQWSSVGPCPKIIQISRPPRDWKLYIVPSTIARSDSLLSLWVKRKWAVWCFCFRAAWKPSRLPRNTIMWLSIWTPKNNKFSICLKWKIHYFRCPNNLALYSLIIMCWNIGTPKNHRFPFGTNGKVVVLGVPILKRFRVVTVAK